MNDNYEILKFDSELFGFGVARILVPLLNTAALQEIIAELRQQKIKLLYWPSDSLDKTSQAAARAMQGHLCSEQVTYVINLENIASFSTPEVIEYAGTLATPELETLALAAGKYSRFVCDPNFPHHLFLKLYQNWIANSANKTLASKILVIQRQQKIVGMITLGEKNQRGDIGLLGIDENFRGHGLGKQLVYAAQKEFAKQGYNAAQVVTQRANIPACKLYEKCGFNAEKIENYYHFWL